MRAQPALSRSERLWFSSSQPPKALNTLSRHMIRLAMAGFRFFCPKIWSV